MKQDANQPANFKRTGPVPQMERARLQAPAALIVFDTPAADVPGTVVRQAARICEMWMPLISLIDHGRQWFKARTGFETPGIPRHMASCAHATGVAGDSSSIDWPFPNLRSKS